MIRKVQASGELYYALMGTINTPEKFEARRLELAKKVWANMTATDSRECRNCHSFGAMDFHKQRRAASERMQEAAAAGQTCISCHKGIAHHLPDMSQDFETTFDDLRAEAMNTSAKAGDVLYALTTKPLFVERPASAAGAPDGRLSAATPVKVLKTDGDWLEVEIDGWRQQGAERLFTRCKVGGFLRRLSDRGRRTKYRPARRRPTRTPIRSGPRRRSLLGSGKTTWFAISRNSGHRESRCTAPPAAPVIRFNPRRSSRRTSGSTP